MTIEEFISNISKEDYELLKKYSQRDSRLFGVSFEPVTKLPYWFVKNDSVQLLSEFKITEFIESCLNLKSIENDLSFETQEDLVKVFEFVLFFMDSIEEINKMEQALFGGESNPDLIAAGVHELNKFGVTNVIDDLADGDITKFEAIKNMKYEEVLEIRYLKTTQAKIRENLFKIQETRRENKKKK